jgi:hypothetical protein
MFERMPGFYFLSSLVHLQIEILDMVTEQAEAYKEAIEEYRLAAHTARLSRATSGKLNNFVDIFPRRQVTNYFTQFRKVRNSQEWPILYILTHHF